MYTFSVYDFSEKEIVQICELVKRWSHGDVWLPIDARRYTKQVKEWGICWHLLEYRRGNRLHLTSCLSYQNVSGAIFNPRYNLPIEALWRLVSPMLRDDGATGYSIVNNNLWMEHLGIAPQNHRFATSRELEEKEDILLLLSAHHYLTFQMAGTVWNIGKEVA